MSIRTLIVDDEAHARARIRHLLKEETDFEIVGECANGRLAVEAIRRERPDLAFLDVQMPRLTGFDVCAELSAGGESLPLVIFCTAYDQYALQAFEVHAIDYLLKPFDRDRFRKTLDHVRTQARRTVVAPEPQLAALLADLKAAQQRPARLAFKCDGRVILLRPDEIQWVEAEGNYVKLHTPAGPHLLRDTLSGLEAQLPADHFMRISRSVIVNLDRVKEVQPLFYGDHVVILLDGTKLTLSRTHRDKLEKLLARPA
jgi:two-component system, LytTR family, response regulator